MRGRLRVPFLLATTIAALFGPSAGADVAVVGALAGTASVGQWFTGVDASTCDQAGEGVTGGRGVSPILSAPYSREGSWRLSASLLSSGVEDGELGVHQGTIHICGRLNPAPLADSGPFCGVSKGFDGQGRAFGFDQVSGGLLDLRLYDFGWKQQVGSILPVVGNFEQRADTGAGTGLRGTAVALVAVSPSADTLDECAGLGSDDGVQAFEVAATFVALTGAEAD